MILAEPRILSKEPLIEESQNNLILLVKNNVSQVISRLCVLYQSYSDVAGLVNGSILVDA